MHNKFNGHALSNVKATISAFVSDADYMKLDPTLKTKLFWALTIGGEWEDEDQDKTNWEEEDYA